MVPVIRLAVAFLALVAAIDASAQSRCDGLVVRQQGVPRARPGDLLQYLVTIHHSGSCRIDSLEVVDYLPQDAEWIEATPVPDEVPDPNRQDPDPFPVSRLKWRERSIQPGESLVIAVRVRVPEMKTGWMRNTVCLGGTGVLRRCSDIETFVRQD